MRQRTKQDNNPNAHNTLLTGNRVGYCRRSVLRLTGHPLPCDWSTDRERSQIRPLSGVPHSGFVPFPATNLGHHHRKVYHRPNCAVGMEIHHIQYQRRAMIRPQGRHRSEWARRDSVWRVPSERRHRVQPVERRSRRLLLRCHVQGRRYLNREIVSSIVHPFVLCFGHFLAVDVNQRGPLIEEFTARRDIDSLVLDDTHDVTVRTGAGNGKPFGRT